MKIVADENIPLLRRFFGELGDLIEKPGREINANDVHDADILLVRSVTQVNQSLLQNSKVRFVGTCTAGLDHVDTEYLSSNKIRFSSAPGANANSVVEYVISSLSILADTHDFDFMSATVGIIGYGNVGSLLAKRLRKLGVASKIYDPLIDDEDVELSSLAEVLACDVISLHVPLTIDGDYPTKGMISAAELASISASQVLINTCRGGVVDEAALKERLAMPHAPVVILDVWENEPCVDAVLAKQVYIGTPHIAGYSFDGKVAGTEMVYRGVCQFLGLPVRHTLGQFLEEPPLSRMSFTSSADTDWCMHTAIRACFDVRHDHGQLMKTLNLRDDERAASFDALRKHYRCRREFAGVRIQLKNGASDLFSKFKGLGFNIKS